MGLAASQGRYLCLTARMSDLVYEGQQISQQRLALTNLAQEAADKYNEAISNTIMQVNTPEGGTQRLTYDVITNQDPFNGLCMRLVDLDGNVVVPLPGYTLDISYTNDKGLEFTSNVSNSAEFITKYMSDLSDTEKNSLAGKDLKELSEYYTQNYPDSKFKITLKDKVNTSLKNDDEHFLYDEKCQDPKYLQEMITTGQWILEQVSPTEESGWCGVVWQGTNNITEVYDTTDDAAAEAEYEAAMKDIQKRDKLLELRLEEVQTEESAVETEIDSIKDVISKNIESSFKTFA